VDQQREIEVREKLDRGEAALRGAIQVLRFLSDPESDRLAGLYELDPVEMRCLGLDAPTPLGQEQAIRMLPGGRMRALGKELATVNRTIREALSKTPAPLRPSHRPAIKWKRWFVSHMARLWMELTGEEPAVTLGSKFANFLAAAWESLGEVPDEAFGNALRDHQEMKTQIGWRHAS
jgi:hypothetical protein